MKTKIFLTFALVLGLIFTSCEDSQNNGETGKLSVSLTDAPFPFDLVAEANVTIFKVEARLKDGEIEHDDDISDKNLDSDNGSSFITLMEQEVDVNLLELTNGVIENLANIEVPIGTYDLVRVYVKGISVVLTDGTTYDLKVPSGEQTGIKVFIKPGIVVNGGLTSDLLLDFDVSRSFVVKGNSKSLEGIKGFNFKPVIKVSNMTVAGTLTGLVTTMENDMPLGLEGAQVSVFAADTLNTTSFTDANGGYTIMGLLAGSYDVEVELEGYSSQGVEDIQISAGNKTVQDFKLDVVQ